MDFQYFSTLGDQPLTFISAYPELFLIIGISIMVTYLAILDHYCKSKIILTNIGWTLTILISFFTLLLVQGLEGLEFYTFNGILVHDDLMNLLKRIVLIFVICLCFLARDYLYKEGLNNYEFYILILLSIVGSFLIINSQDLISLYLGIELQSLSFYLLATSKQFDNLSSEAGIKYFILGAFSSGLLLYGCSWLYGSYGSVNLSNLISFLRNLEMELGVEGLLVLSISLITFGFLFKLGAAPFHTWVPDVYEGSPTIVTAFFAIIPKILIISALARITYLLVQDNIIHHSILIFMSAFASIFVGAFGALYQVKIKRLLAYSAISHVGFILIAMIVNSLEAATSMYFYIIAYMVLSLNMFAILVSLRRANNNRKLKTIQEFKLILKSNKVLTYIFCFTLFSIAGIPPFIGFFSKVYIFMSGIQYGVFFFILSVAIFSVVSTLYYIRLIKSMLFDKPSHYIFLKPIKVINSLIISITFMFNFFFLLFPNFLLLEISALTRYFL